MQHGGRGNSGLGSGGVAAALMLLAALTAVPATGQRAAGRGDRFERTHSKTDYVHRIPLRDAQGQKIDPTDPDAPPYSPAKTCGKCHDYDGISHGYHFNAVDGEARDGRPGEPWIWTDQRTGRQIPVSYRDWAGAPDPGEVGMSRWRFVLEFGRHMPGGGPGERSAGASTEKSENGDGQTPGKWNLSGKLEVDCMVCHAADNEYQLDAWAEQIGRQNFRWASTAALNLGQVEGRVGRLPDDFDPSAQQDQENDNGPSLPAVRYNRSKFDAEGRHHFNVVGEPTNNACYRCHSNRRVGGGAADDAWTHEGDVHIEAGLSCVDCHRNGIGHHTVRGYEGEQHPTGLSVETLSCRGCHLGTDGNGEKVADLAALGGRLGAPEPEHAGFPPLHFRKLSCTACHSGPLPEDRAGKIQTAMAHGLGLPGHRDADMPPGIVAPVYKENGDGRIGAFKMVWPAFWGVQRGDGSIEPLNPDEVFRSIRRSMRIRSSLIEKFGDVRLSASERSEVLGEDRADAKDLTEAERRKLQQLRSEKAAEQFRGKLGDALDGLSRVARNGTPVFVSGGKVFRNGEDGLETIDHEAAEPYAWPMAHDVRPARRSLGARSCKDCHAPDSAYQYGTVAAVSPAPDDEPPTKPMYEYQGLRAGLLAAWDRVFAGRDSFKWLAFPCLAIVTLTVLLYALLGLRGALRWVAARGPGASSRSGQR